MMDFTWYILGVLTGAVAYSLYMVSKKYTLNWLLWSGLIAGSTLILFTIDSVAAKGKKIKQKRKNTDAENCGKNLMALCKIPRIL